MLYLQRHTKDFRYITAYGEKCLKRILIYLDTDEYNEINVCHSDEQKHVSYKNVIKSTNIMCTGSHKSFLMHSILERKNFKAYFNIFIFH